ncbi:MAG TPA: ABC transporter permease [Candidatus Acidoferrum sp.]|nr:ABC transporter permease [Candidatus Acidoferrum sp.]
MRFLSLLRSVVASLFHRTHVENDTEEELRAHVQKRVEDLERLGLTPMEANRRARIEFGAHEKFKEQCREERGGFWLETVWTDIRFGARMLRRSPGFTAVAILTLALGIGANTAIFSVVNAVLLQPLPYPNANRLALIWSQWGKEMRGPASGPELIELRKRCQAFEEIGGIWPTSGTITGTGEPEQVRLAFTTANFLPLLAEKPQLGRFFAPGEDRRGAAPFMILTDGLWRRQFGANPGIIGQTARLNGNEFTVVGVLPRDFKLMFPDGSGVMADVQVFITFLDDLEKRDRSTGFLRMVGRLRNGVTVAQAQSEGELIATQLRGEAKEYADQSLHLTVASLQDDDVRLVRPALLSLFAAVGLVLLVTCANVANLLLSRSGGRKHETALRTAMGAERWRIVRQLLTESLLLSCLGGAVALGIGWAALKWILSLQPEGISRLVEVRLDVWVLAFTLGLSILTGVLFGLAPALLVSRVDLTEALKESGQTTATARPWFRQVLIVSEVALGCIVLVGTGLMIRTLASVLRVDPGFRAENVLTFQLSFPWTRYRTVESITNFLKELRTNLAAMPGTESVSGISHLPLDEGKGNWYSYYWADGAPVEQQNTVMADHRSTLPGYFRSIGATLLAGREFEDTDDTAHTHVAILDDLVAEQLWPGQDAIGKKLSVEDSPKGPFQFERESVVVVGMVKHLQAHSLTTKGRGQIYLPVPLAPRPVYSIVVRTTEPMQTFAAFVQQGVKKLDKEMPLSNLQPQMDYVEKARAQTRFVTVLAGALGVLALFLACIGIYGVTSYSVSERKREIAIRIAVGADSTDVGKMVLRQSGTPVLVGVMAGLALAAALTPLLSGMLFGVRPGDPLTYLFIALVLAAVGVAACYVPAHRATKVDPIIALRSE